MFRLFRSRADWPDPTAQPPLWKLALRSPRIASHWLIWVAPVWIKSVFAVIALVLCAGAAYYMTVRMPQARRMEALTVGWRNFEQAAQTVDEVKMRAALEEVRAVSPSDQLVSVRQTAIDTRSADPTDPAMAAITLRMSLRAGDWDSADREAEKLLATAPYDWTARCTRTWIAYQRGDKDVARIFLSGLPAPDDRRARLDPNGLLFAIRLYRDLERDPEPLFTYIRTDVLKALGTPTALSQPAAVKVQLVECYLSPFETVPGMGRPNLDGFGAAWATISQVADRAVEEAANGTKDKIDIPVLIAAGRLTNRLATALKTLQEEGQVHADQFAPLLDEVIARGKRAWQAAQERDPKNPDTYHGLALLAWQTGDPKTARQVVAKGLTTGAVSPGLYALFVQIMQADSRPDIALQAVWQAAERNPKDSVWWALAAEAALGAHRRDQALIACEKARTSTPPFPGIARLEGKLWLDAGEPHRAVEQLRTLGETTLAADPHAARLYARALVEAGLSGLAEDFLTKVEAAARQEDGKPAPAAAAIRGMAEAKPIDLARLDMIAKRADQLMARFRDDPDMIWARADALARAAEATAPKWDVIRTRMAIAALERARARFPDDKDLSATLAWIQLKGNKHAPEALRDASTLVRSESEPLPASQLEVLGAVYLANDRPEAAIRVVERARKTGWSTSGGLITLAQAYKAAGQMDRAAAALAAAANLPRNPQQEADYQAAVQLLKKQESP